ncbi:hypothetical protein K474DRAFT_713802 [Panus rudis PR-1116 ss-1]|nr:hypothetical protein K474DRAFT_713802 [Panus rudis PR-1116 ss-1]
MHFSIALAFALTSVVSRCAFAIPVQSAYYYPRNVAVASYDQHTQPELDARAYEYSAPLVSRDVFVHWPGLHARALAYHDEDGYEEFVKRGPEGRPQLAPLYTSSYDLRTKPWLNQNQQVAGQTSTNAQASSSFQAGQVGAGAAGAAGATGATGAAGAAGAAAGQTQGNDKLRRKGAIRRKQNPLTNRIQGTGPTA